MGVGITGVVGVFVDVPNIADDEEEEDDNVDEEEIDVLAVLRFVELIPRTTPELVQVTLAVQLVVSVQNLWRYVELSSPKAHAAQ